MIHLKKKVASFLLASLNPELSRAKCCVSFRYTLRPLSPMFSLSPEASSFNATPARLHVNNNCPAVLTKRFAIKKLCRRGRPHFILEVLQQFLLSSRSNSFSLVRPNWLLTSSLFTSALCWVAQFRRFLDTPRSSLFRGSLPILSSYPRLSTRSGRYFSRWSLVTCFILLLC